MRTAMAGHDEHFWVVAGRGRPIADRGRAVQLQPVHRDRVILTLRGQRDLAGSQHRHPLMHLSYRPLAIGEVSGLEAVDPAGTGSSTSLVQPPPAAASAPSCWRGCAWPRGAS